VGKSISGVGSTNFNSKMKKFLIIIYVLLNTVSFAKEFHVSKKGNDSNDGSVTKPFKTIAAAIKYAYAGDTITVHEGTYREWVNPIRGGESDSKRIMYRAASGEKVEIKGSEIVTGWQKVKDGVWKVVIPNSFFGNYNPYQDSIYGDWFFPLGRKHHTGEVFLNGKSLYEKENIENVQNPLPPKVYKNFDGSIYTKADIDGSKYTWYCEVNDQNTTIWANFHKFNPNKELIEISTRRTCFYPEKQGINYLTIQGFNISQAATQWSTPTAEQVGMVATHWNKGWIIENNVIHDSKCAGITLGKERGTGQNVWSADPSLDGSVYYIEVIFRTLRNGWNKENIGSHIVRNNEIFNCEQVGINGSMGGAFGIIENNHIYNIFTKRQYNGAEMGGIKFHGAIDAIIRKNRIHDCHIGMWLDWMTQGTRVSANLFYNNDEVDISLETNHGPFLVDNNILLSTNNINYISQSGAFVHNLFTGKLNIWAEHSRFTPYHLPHSTDIAGITTIAPGDDRYYNNIFIGQGQSVKTEDINTYGLSSYNDSILLVPWKKGKRKVELPVWINGNVYYNGAYRYKNENQFIEKLNFNPDLKLVEKDKNVFLQFVFDDSYFSFSTQIITTEILGKSKIAKENFENPDATPLILDTDYLGNKRSKEKNTAGPFSNLTGGKLEIIVW